MEGQVVIMKEGLIDWFRASEGQRFGFNSMSAKKAMLGRFADPLYRVLPMSECTATTQPDSKRKRLSSAVGTINNKNCQKENQIQLISL